MGIDQSRWALSYRHRINEEVSGIASWDLLFSGAMRLKPLTLMALYARLWLQLSYNSSDQDLVSEIGPHRLSVSRTALYIS